jgi:hypothetical protein
MVKQGHKHRCMDGECTLAYDVRVNVLLDFDRIVHSHAELGKSDVVAARDSLQLLRAPTALTHTTQPHRITTVPSHMRTEPHYRTLQTRGTNHCLQTHLRHQMHHHRLGISCERRLPQARALGRALLSPLKTPREQAVLRRVLTQLETRWAVEFSRQLQVQ